MSNEMSEKNMEAWKGFRDFYIEKKVYESKDIISLYLKPKDNLGLADIKAGQFIGVKIKNADEKMKKAVRLYSISSKPNENHYRITIKIVEGGMITNYIDKIIKVGDILEVTTPKGNFKLENEKIIRSIVLLGGGIGVTPVYSMLQHIDSEVKKQFVYSLRNRESQCFLDEIKAYKSENTKVDIFFTRPLKEDKEGIDFDVSGRLSKEWIKDNVDLNSDFYFCGNKGFIDTVKESLEILGIEKERIHYEFF